MAVGEQNLMAERMDDEEVGVHIIHDGLEGFAHLLFFAASFLFEEFRVKPETIGGLFVVEVDPRTLAARLSGAVYEAGKSEGIIGRDGDAMENSTESDSPSNAQTTPSVRWRLRVRSVTSRKDSY